MREKNLRQAVSRDQVAQSFYKQFKAEHAAFAALISGLAGAAEQAWVASLMLNRLMFIYFIQRKGFLDGNPNYLADRIQRVRSAAGDGYFHSFYRPFLRRLFHEGLGQAKGQRDADLAQLIGDVPYLNGGLFAVHELEESHPEIDIPDAAFERLFAFFDAHDWQLDDRPLSSGKAINPDVLGYIFEKYINQKQMGAYYTKEDITEYIAKNTVIPHLLEQARQRCTVAFEGESSVGHLLKAEPERYLYPAMKTGVIDASGKIIPESALPNFVQIGMNDPKARLFERRYNLGEALFHSATGERGTLPTETWREYVERRKRCLAVREQLASGALKSADDLITHNLDIRQFMQDVIDTCRSPDVLRAVWQAIAGRVPEKSSEKFRHGITILDPTCGSGAFLFAALNVLEPLYEACLDRMAGFVEDARRLPSPASGRGARGEGAFADFAKVLQEVDRHPSRRYFIDKSIILHNLFGVDIMAEAVEICKLRLFLKLVSQVDAGRELEPLPDIDFNIRAGNSLVGYAAHTLASDPLAARDPYQLNALRLKLDRALAGDYGIDPDNAPALAAWRASHQPFHWCAEFYGVMRAGGFDVVIGNPPYVELSSVTTYKPLGFELESTGNLFSICTERFVHLMGSARLGVIVPISAVSTPRMTPMRVLMEKKFSHLWVSNFAVRPAKLFSGVDMNLSILMGRHPTTEARPCACYSTRYNRWNESARDALFPTLSYAQSLRYPETHAIFKVGTALEGVLLRKVQAQKPLSFSLPTKNGLSTKIYYHSGGRYFRKCLEKKLSNEYKELLVKPGEAKNMISIISSSLYYWYWLLESDCYHVTKTDVLEFPLHPAALSDPELIDLGSHLLVDLEKNAIVRNRRRKSGEVVQEANYYVGKSKGLIDLIDLNVAKHYALTAEETDFIVNYDLKYRMGGSDEAA